VYAGEEKMVIINGIELLQIAQECVKHQRDSQGNDRSTGGF
jgi:hypothetical protein